MELDYDFPDRDLVNSREWLLLCRRAQVDSVYGTAQGNQDERGFESDVFVIRPYDWSEPDECLPNFEHKPSGFKLWWYKYAFRSTNMNQPLSSEEIKSLFESCTKSIVVSQEELEQEKLLEEKEALQDKFKRMVDELNGLLSSCADSLGIKVSLNGNENDLLKKIQCYAPDEETIDLYFKLKK